MCSGLWVWAWGGCAGQSEVGVAKEDKVKF